MYTSPTMVAFGAMNTSFSTLGFSLQRFMMGLAFVIFYENLLVDSIAFGQAQNRYLAMPRLISFFNIKTLFIQIHNKLPLSTLKIIPNSHSHSQYTSSYAKNIKYQISTQLIMLFSRLCHFAIRTTKLKPGQYDFLDLVRAPIGSQISITAQEKQKINKQIDQKMQELQDTGLSREQILLSKSQKGLPLAIDPFFQYLKRNRLAREIYLRKNDRFSVEKIIDIALRQDIGPDPSYSRTRDYGRINEKGRAEVMHSDLQQREKDYFNPSSYYANSQTKINKLYDELKPHQPLRHIYKPINRYERVKTHQRRLKKYDIHWRNVELLRQFMTSYGNIKSRLTNRLSVYDQKRVKVAIKSARHNCAIPFYGRTLNPNKRNITSLEQEVKEIGLQNVNLETGQIYYSRPESMDSKQLQIEEKSDTDWRYEQMIKGNNYQLWIDTPDTPQNEDVINAERYARHLKASQNKQSKTIQTAASIRKKALRQVTGLSEQEEIAGVKADDSEKSKASFEKRKSQLSRKLAQQPLSFSQIILNEKTLL